MIDKFINKIHQGNSLDIIRQMPDNSVDCVITSPPYWQLRDYGYDDQWGLEPTYQEYLENLWSLMDEVYRILKPTGTAWINLGDSYSTQSGTNTALARGGKNWDTSTTYLTNRGESAKINKGNIPSKCLLLIPHRFAIGLSDGVNGHKQWIIRNDIIWSKKNSMPESVTDRFSKKHEYFFFMAKNKKYYFDLDGIRDKYNIESIKRELRGNGPDNKYADGTEKPKGVHANTMSQARRFKGYNDLDKYVAGKSGKNPGDVSDFWDVNTKGSSEKHCASFNFELIEKPIIAGSPEDGIVLDPFCGVGTTLVRALQLGRRIIGIDGSKEYCEIAEKKISKELNQLQLF